MSVERFTNTDRMYPTFVSIMFAFALGVLLIPIESLTPSITWTGRSTATVSSRQSTNLPTEHYTESNNEAVEVISQSAGRFYERFPILGIVMLGVILALWWWYAIFFARISPADKPLYYFLDFLVLTGIALAAKMWPDHRSWVWAALVAISLLIIRFFITAHWSASDKTRDWSRGKRNILERMLKSDKHVLVGAYTILLMCFVAIGFILWGAATDEERVDSTFINGLLFAVSLGVFYTISVALFIPEASGFRSITEHHNTYTRLRPAALLPDYEFCTNNNINLAKRCKLLEEGSHQFYTTAIENSVRLGQYPCRVHADADVGIQALAMSLRFEDADEASIRLCGYITRFLHWIDDCLDYGPLYNAAYDWLEREYTRNTNLKDNHGISLDTEWTSIFQRKADASTVGFMCATEKLVPNAARDQFKRGLRRLVLGAIATRQSCSRPTPFANWLNNQHAAAFRTLCHVPSAMDEQGLLQQLDPRTLVLTSKPIQECWNTSNNPDPDWIMAVMNYVLLLPVFLHNSVAEIEEGELHSTWSDWVQNERFTQDMRKIKAWLSAIVADQTFKVALDSRRSQIGFVQRVCESFLKNERDPLANELLSLLV